MISKKKCKAQGKAKGFESCDKMVPAEERTYGLCKKCLGRWIYSTHEGAIYLEKITLRAKKKVEKENRKKEREQKLANSDYKAKLQDRINEIARLIDIGLPCLVKGYHAGQIHGGHIFSRGAEYYMRYNLHNIHRQSAQSNHNGNDDGQLRENLAMEYSDEYLDFLSGMRKMGELKYTNAEYREFYKNALKIANELKRRGQRFNRDQRIELRNEINSILGIYPKEYCVYGK